MLSIDQGQCFRALLKTQAENWQVIQSLVQSAVTLAVAPVVSVPKQLVNKGPQDAPETFTELFEHVTEVSLWPTLQWAAHLLLLLSGEAQRGSPLSLACWSTQT